MKDQETKRSKEVEEILEWTILLSGYSRIYLEKVARENPAELYKIYDLNCLRPEDINK